jgi:hypothetical protein
VSIYILTVLKKRTGGNVKMKKVAEVAKGIFSAMLGKDTLCAADFVRQPHNTPMA